MPAAGVRKQEIDLSLYAEIGSDLKIGLVGLFSKGPINERTLITNLPMLESVFGKPIDDDALSSGFFSLREYFRNANQAFVVRAESATSPSTLSKAGIRGGTNESLASGTDGATSIPATKTLTSASASFITAGVLVGDVVGLLSGTDAGFYKVANVAATILTVDRNWPAGSQSSVSYNVYSNKHYTSSVGVTSAPSARTFTVAGAKFISAGVAAGDLLYINDISSPGDNGFYVVSSVSSETALIVNSDFPVGGLTILDYSIYGDNHPSLADGSTATAGEFLSATAKFAKHKVAAGDLLVIADTIDIGNNGTYVITGLKVGATDTTLTVNVPTWPAGSLTGLTYRIIPGSLTLSGESNGSWANDYVIRSIRNPVATSQFDIMIYDTDNFLQESILGLTSSTVVADMLSLSSLFPTVSVLPNRLGPALTYDATVVGGTDGTTGLADADLIGTGLKGLQLFKNIEEVEVDVLLIPGYSASQNVGDALLTMAEITRGDCMALIDPPDSPTVDTPQEAVDWSNGTGGYGRTSALNSSYSASYWSWQKIYDPYYDVDRFTAPSGHAVAAMAHSDNLTKSWFAPAGIKRGKVVGATACRYSPDLGERRYLQDTGSLNPIVNFVNEGIHIYGQKTLLRTASALNRVNVRRMLLYVERACLKVARNVVFDPNDSATDREIVRLLTPVMEYVQDNRGLQEFLIVCDDTTSPAAVRENSEIIGKVYLKPTKAAEIITLQFVLTAQSVNFSELLAG